MSQWISVKDRLPEPCESILLAGETACKSCSPLKVRNGKMNRQKNFEFGEFDCPFYATHWMPLPEPPKDG